MSQQSNQQVVERAYELAEDLTSTTEGKVIAYALDRYEEDKDVEALWRTVANVEANRAQEHYFNNNILGANDVY